MGHSDGILAWPGSSLWQQVVASTVVVMVMVGILLAVLFRVVRYSTVVVK